MNRKPLGITILGSLIICFGLSNLFLIFIGIGFYLNILGFIFNVFILASGIGVLLLKNWARIGVIIISGLIGLFSALALLLFFGDNVFISFMFALLAVVCAAIFYYFTRPKVKECFKKNCK